VRAGRGCSFDSQTRAGRAATFVERKADFLSLDGLETRELHQFM
jgi:hypothetical protein